MYPQQVSSVEERPSALTRRSATFISSFSLAGRLLERASTFAQIVLIASVYGAAVEADAYFAAAIVPLIIGTVGGEALATSLLPPLLREASAARTRGLVAAGLWTSLALTLTATLLYLAAVVPLAEWRFAGDYGRLAPWFAFAPVGIVVGVAAYLGAVLLRFERYAWAAVRAGIAAFAAFVLSACVLLATHELAWVAAAVSAGYALAALVVAVDVTRVLGIGWLRPPRRHDVRVVVRSWRNVVSGLVGGLLGGQVFVLLERALAATFTTGGIATVSYARGITFTPNVVVQSITSGIYPAMMRAHEAEDRERLVQRFFHGLRLSLFVSCGFAALFALFGPNIVGFLLQRGAFGGDSTVGVGRTVSAFSLALIGSMLIIFATRVFYATDFFRAVVWVQGAALAAYAATALPFRSLWGPPGLALAFGVAELVGGIFGVVLATRRLGIEPWTVVRRGLLPGLRLGLRVAFALLLYRVVVESTWWEVPQAWKGIVMVGGAFGVGAVTAGKALWGSGWPEAQRMKDAAWKLVLLAFRR